MDRASGQARPTFPADPWATLPAGVREDFEGYFAAATEALMTSGAVPRLDTIGHQLLLQQKRPGRVLLYPAGMFAKSAIPLLEADSGITIVGVIDRRGAALGSFCGHPVITIEGIASVEFDYVQILHPVYEAYFREFLIAAGVAAHRVRGLFTLPESTEAWRKDLKSSFSPKPVKTVCKTRNVVILRHMQTIVSEAVIAQIFDPAETLVLWIGAPFSKRPTRHFRVQDTFLSVDVLFDLLAQIRPEKVYLATLVAENFYGLLVRKAAPEALLIHEIYDWSIMCPDHGIAPVHMATLEQVGHSRAGEYWSVSKADAVITKRRGPCWDKVEAAFKVPYVRFNQGSQLPRNPVGRSDGPPGLSVVYAGPVPYYDTAEDWPFLRFTPMLEALADRKDLWFELYNSFHQRRAEDHRFAPMLRKFSGKLRRYHRRTPLSKMIDVLPRFDYGWLCVHTWNDLAEFPDTHTVVSARVATYVAAGLPIIIDDSWEATTDLIEKYSAGFVVSNPKPSDIETILSRVDPERHRAGALQLRRLFLEENDAAIRTLKGLRRFSSATSAAAQ